MGAPDFASRFVPALVWADLQAPGHAVKFFDDDSHLIESLGDFLGPGLESGAAAVAIATPPHRAELERTLRARGVDVAGARRRRQLVLLDAAETLEAISGADGPDADLFQKVVGSLLVETRATHPRVLVFGEMVALLWGADRRDAALELERMWSELVRAQQLSLLCAYPMSSFGAASQAEPFGEVCAEHTRVLPAESYAAEADAAVRLRTICELQQKAAALEREVSERKRLEEALNERVAELAEADRRKNEFLAMLGHELRNPLAPIRNVTELLRGIDGVEPAQRRMFDILDRQVGQLTRLLDDLLDVGRITQGRIQLRRETVDLKVAISRAVEACQPAIDACGHRLGVTVPEGPIQAKGDLARLVQVFSNLLGNAAKYTPAGGRISVEARCLGPFSEVRIEDSGCGLTAEMLPRVFEPFVQVERTLDRSDGGLGIGLTLVRGIVALHGGEVAASSDGPGTGSQFIVRLPIPAGVELGAHRFAVAGAEVPRRKRILVVDDNEDAAESTALLLRGRGHEVSVAGSGPEALDLARREPAQVVLLDIGLPGMDGYEVARRLRALASTTWIVALTGYGQLEHRRRASRAGFDHHLVKPVDPSALIELLDDLDVEAP